MKNIHKIDDLTDFEPWGGAVKTYKTLTHEQLQQLCCKLNDCYPNGITDTAINDILWVGEDWIAECLGYKEWNELKKANNK